MTTFILQIRRNGHLLTSAPVFGQRIVIGRAHECDIVLQSADVSRRHAELVVTSAGLVLKDLGSHNGVLVNGRKITAECTIRPRDRINIATFELSLVSQGGAAESPGGAVAAVPTSSDDERGEFVRTIHAFHPPTIDAKHISTLVEFSGAILAEASSLRRRRLLCELMTSQQFHGTTARTLRVRRGDMAIEALGDPVTTGDAPPPHVSWSVLRAVVDGGVPAIAVSRPDLNNGPGILKMTAPAQAAPGAAAVACPIRQERDFIDIVYVTLPEAYGSAEWLALASLASSLFRQAESAWAALESVQARAVLEEELRRARELQMRLVPRDFVDGRLDVSFGYAPCTGVGGDYVDAVRMRDGRVLLVAMDVSGKGMDAALVASGLHTTVHLCAELGISLGAMIRLLNDYLMETWGEYGAVTVAASILDPRTGKIESINCGHPEPLVVGPGDQLRELAVLETVPLGFVDVTIDTVMDELAPGQLLAYYSDGLTECFDQDDNMLGLDGLKRILARLDASARRPGGALVDELFARLADVRGSAAPSDDVSFILARLSA